MKMMICPYGETCPSKHTCRHSRPHVCNSECDIPCVYSWCCKEHNPHAIHDDYEKALKLLALLAPSLRPNADGMFDTANGQKSIVGVYRLIKENV